MFGASFDGYSPERDGDLTEYLISRFDNSADNAFFGPEYYFVMKDNGWLMPFGTTVRVNRGVIPDLSYVVNDELLLESSGRGEFNMSCVGAEKGVYEPDEALKDVLWSAHFLKIHFDRE